MEDNLNNMIEILYFIDMQYLLITQNNYYNLLARNIFSEFIFIIPNKNMFIFSRYLFNLWYYNNLDNSVII